MLKCSKSEVQRLKTVLRWKKADLAARAIQMVLLRGRVALCTDEDGNDRGSIGI
jgi:hypothetical protein